MTTIKSLRDRIKRQEAAMSQTKKLKNVRGRTLDTKGSPSPSKGDTIVPGTKDRMPGAKFGDDDYKKKKSKKKKPAKKKPTKRSKLKII